MITASQLKKLVQLGLFRKIPVKKVRLLSVEGIKKETRGISDDTLRSLAALVEDQIDYTKI